MNDTLKLSILDRMKQQTGHTGFYYKNLITGEELGYQENEPYLAASVIKLPIFMCISKWASEGKCTMDEKIHVGQEDKLPICGALTLFTDELDVDIRTGRIRSSINELGGVMEIDYDIAVQKQLMSKNRFQIRVKRNNLRQEI